MFCQVEVPTYLKYIQGWERVVSDFPSNADLIIILDTASSDLLIKTQGLPEAKQLHTKPVLLIDHHSTESDFSFKYDTLIEAEASSTSIILYKLAVHAQWAISDYTADLFTQSIMADTQGLSNDSTNLEAFEIVTELVRVGVSPVQLENRRRKLMKKSQSILAYKGELIKRINYSIEGQLATIHIPWDEIEEYSHAYNPSMLVIDEMRMVEDVKVAIAYKTYPDGKILVKIRCNPDAPIGEELAKQFGGGGHPCASGFKLFNKPLDELKIEVIKEVTKLLKSL